MTFPRFALMRRRTAVALAALSTLAAIALPQAAQAQAYPNKPIRLVVPFVVVDNKPGASGNIGTQMVAAADPDGYTLLLAFDGTMVINPHVFAKVPFDTVKDFAPVGKIGDAVLILVAHPGFPGKKLQDVIAMSKTQAGGLSYGTSGTGGTPHIAGELLRQRTGANLVHVPYKGGGQARCSM
jgi:tripartite-type tricarboxylate transporter receptor subunit TctC